MALVATENGAYDSLDGAPSPATSGTTLTVHNSALWPDPATVGPYSASAWPSAVAFDNSVGERVMVTGKSGAVLTIVRACEGSTARSIAVGWQFAKGWGAQDGRGALMVGDRNLLINPGFAICQPINPATTTLATGGAHGPDGWYLLTQTGNAGFARTAGPLAGAKSQYYCYTSNASGGTQRMLWLQVIPAWRTIALRGEAIKADIQLAGGLGYNGRVALLEWTGTADAVTKTIVNTWTSTNYTPGNFFTSTTKNVLGVSGSVVVPGTGAAVLGSVRGTVGASATNLILAIWTEGAIANTDTFLLSDAQVSPESLSAPYMPRPMAEEMALCQYFYCKTFARDTAPAQNAGVNTGYTYRPATIAGANLNLLGTVSYPVPMRVTPTVTTYSPNAASAQAYDWSLGGVCTVTTVNNQTEQGHGMYCTANAGTVVGNNLAVHWTADARL